VSKSRTGLYMKEVNEKMLEPRALKVNIVSTEAMRSIFWNSGYRAGLGAFDSGDNADEHPGLDVVGCEAV
jgi:hypothetical protein